MRLWGQLQPRLVHPLEKKSHPHVLAALRPHLPEVNLLQSPQCQLHSQRMWNLIVALNLHPHRPIQSHQRPRIILFFPAKKPRNPLRVTTAPHRCQKALRIALTWEAAVSRMRCMIPFRHQLAAMSNCPVMTWRATQGPQSPLGVLLQLQALLVGPAFLLHFVNALCCFKIIDCTFIRRRDPRDPQGTRCEQAW
jgi:hypothetical protein